MVTELYGAGLARVVEVAAEHGPELMDELVADELIASLLTVHGLHPDDLRSRVEDALTSVRPFLAQHGGDVELVDIDADAGAVLIRLLGSCDGCPSSSVTLQLAVEAAITVAAPEITLIDVDAPAPVVAGTPVLLQVKPKPVFDSCPAEATRA